MKQLVFSLIAVLGLGHTASAAPAKDTVAVMDFSAINAPASEASVLSEFVRSAVIQSGVYTVVDKKNMDKLLNEQAFQQTGCTSDECAVKLGRVLNVRKMIVGSYSQMGDTRFLTSRLVDVETGKIEASAKEKGFTPEDADTAAERMVASLVGGEPPAESPPPADTRLGLGKRRAATQEQYVAPVRRTPSDQKGYIMFFTGATSGIMKNIKVESLGQYSGIPAWKEKFVGEVEMEQDMAPFGFRAGAWGDIWGVDGEFSMSRLKSKAKSGKIDGVSYNGIAYTKYTGAANLRDGWRIDQSYTMGMNLYLHVSSKIPFQPYAGFGFGMSFNPVTSDTLVLDSGEKFSELGIGFYAKFPLGARLRLADWFFLYGEYQPCYKWVTFSTTMFTENWRQDYQITSNMITAGMGFLF
jgi:hypothetical protein